MLRLFFAISIDPAVLRNITDLQQRLRVAVRDRDIRWTTSDQMHITLKFLGDTHPDLVSKLAQQARQCTAPQRPFAVELRDIGGFPDMQRPRVGWVGIASGATEMGALAGQLDQRMAALGFAKEARGFQPHITLARAKSPRAATALGAALQQIASVSPLGSFHASEVLLMKSTLLPSGAEYETVAALPLGEDVTE